MEPARPDPYTKLRLPVFIGDSVSLGTSTYEAAQQYVTARLARKLHRRRFMHAQTDGDQRALCHLRVEV
jgi:hypothetical protein